VLRPLSLSSSRKLSSSPSISSPDEIKSTEWMESEDHFPPLEIKVASDCPRVILSKGTFKSNKCYSAGLSSNCHLVYFLREKDIMVYSLNDYPKVTEANIILKRSPSANEDYKDTRATLTNRFLAVLSRGKTNRLSIYEHDSLKAQGKDVGFEVLDTWYPTCISMFEASNRTWVAIGGRSNRDGHIRLYRIEDSHGKLCLKKHDAQFENYLPNALSNDWPKCIDFSPDGRRLICVTKNKNKVLVWFLSNNARPRQAPFEIMKSYEAVSDSSQNTFLFIC
jgi:WD40 repeat protein